MAGGRETRGGRLAAAPVEAGLRRDVFFLGADFPSAEDALESLVWSRVPRERGLILGSCSGWTECSIGTGWRSAGDRVRP